MARKQGTKVATKVERLSLAEVKAQTGRYVFVTYEGVDKGGWSLPAPRPRFAGDVVEELMILPFEPKMIVEEWLEEPRFMRLYDTVPQIKVWKSDDLPEEVKVEIPKDLDTALNDVQKAYARNIALSPYNEQMRDVIAAQDREHSEEEVVRQNKKVILPFLKLVQFYEKRYMQRPEVLKALDDRINAILKEKSRMETAESY
jgi:hypothetical protein